MAWHYPQDFSLCCLKLRLVEGAKPSDCHRRSLHPAFGCMRARCAFATFSTVSSRTPFLNVAVTCSLPTSADSSIKICSERHSDQTVLLLVSSCFDHQAASLNADLDFLFAKAGHFGLDPKGFLGLDDAQRNAMQ